MKTPMQELIEVLKIHRDTAFEKEGIFDAETRVYYESRGKAFSDDISFAEVHLEKEKEVIEEAYDDGYLDRVFKSSEQYFEKTFNTKECYHNGKYTYNKETFECHKCGLIVPNEYRFNTKEK